MVTRNSHGSVRTTRSSEATQHALFPLNELLLDTVYPPWAPWKCMAATCERPW
jgi:hypothetical protein